MKRLILLMQLVVTSVSIMLAQDIIITNDAKRIDAVVIEISDTEVRYQKGSNKKDPVFVISTAEIASIIFQNGDVKSFSAPKKSKSQDVALSSDYVDLGLPSGTLWKKTSEEKYYTYSKAVKTFGVNLPTKAQFYELRSNCTWNWTGKGVEVVGPNGNSIFIPALGWKECMSHHLPAPGMGNVGSYWSSTPDMMDTAWSLDFASNRLRTISSWRCNQQAVRLVK